MEESLASKYANAIYYGLLVIGIVVFTGFSYLAYRVYQGTVNTEFVIVSYIVMTPVVVSGILLVLLILMGKRVVAQEVLSVFGKE